MSNLKSINDRLLEIQKEKEGLEDQKNELLNILPKSRENVDIHSIKRYVNLMCKELQEGSLDEDYPQHLFEFIMTEIYGDDIFTWWNEYEI